MSEYSENDQVMNPIGIALFVASSALFRFMSSSSSSLTTKKGSEEEGKQTHFYNHVVGNNNNNNNDDAVIMRRRRNYMKRRSRLSFSFGNYVEARGVPNASNGNDGYSNYDGNGNTNIECVGTRRKDINKERDGQCLGSTATTTESEWILASRRFDHHFDLNHELDSSSNYEDIKNHVNEHGRGMMARAQSVNSYFDEDTNNRESKPKSKSKPINTNQNILPISRLSFHPTFPMSHDRNGHAHFDHVVEGEADDNYHHTNEASNNNNNNNSFGYQQQQNEDNSFYNEDCATFNSRIMPRRLILIRHGQSEGNVDESLYASCPDSNIRLTKRGWDQAKSAGRILREEIILKSQSCRCGGGTTTTASTTNCDGKIKNNPTVHFIVSPYVRTMETFHGLASAWCDPNDFADVEDEQLRLTLWYEKLSKMGVTFNEDPRIREQDFGNYQDEAKMKKSKKERYKFGIFYYRFPNGESASDVFDRISTFLDSLWRSFSSNHSQNYVLVTHGISIRVLLARYFRYSIDQFNVMANPSNCEMILLGHDGKGRLELEGRCQLEENHDQNEEGDNSKMSYRFFKKLKVPKFLHAKSRTIRMDYC